MCVCVYVYMCICISVHMRICVNVYVYIYTCRVQNPDIPRAGRGGSGRGGAWPGRKGRRRFGSPRKHLSLVHTTTVLNDSSEARTV